MNLNAQFNVDPSVWGPHMWATIHTLALKADADNEIEPYNEFINSLLFLLPCDACRLDYTKYCGLHGNPVVGTAFDWSVRLHNYVNEKLGRPTYTIEQARAQWTDSHCSYKCQNTKAIVEATQTFGSAYTFVFALVILVIVYALYKRK
jgi:hypothetical protein